MDYVLKYRLFPDKHQREQLDWVRDTVRQLYNHALHRFNRIPESAGTVKQRVTQVRDELPDLKDWWIDLTKIYSTVLQQAVEQIATNIENLGKLKQKGFDVGSLNWKAPHEYRSFTYRQRGFELDDNSGPDGRGLLTLKKVNGEPFTGSFSTSPAHPRRYRRETRHRQKRPDWRVVRLSQR